jgi:hypothetical protein
MWANSSSKTQVRASANIPIRFMIGDDGSDGKEEV